jgi:hypothetical protein
MPKSFSYDPACETLAEHFLGDRPELKPLRQRLAQHIQEEVEGWLTHERDQIARELGITLEAGDL